MKAQIRRFLGYEAFISWRYLRSKRKEVFISLITVISISGVAVGVTALIIVLAVMTGLTGELRDKILGANAHILLFKRGGWIQEYEELQRRIASVEHVVGVAPFIYQQAMIQAEGGSAEPTIKGIVIEAERTTSELEGHVTQGSLDFLEAGDDNTPRPGSGLIFGARLANQLGIKVGDSVAVIAPMKEAASTWPVPKQQMFQVSGIFEYGMFEYDSHLAYMSLRAAQEYFQTGDMVSGIEVKVENMFGSKRVADVLQEELGLGYSVRDWSEMNKNLFAVFGLYKKAMFLMLALIVVVACLNIASTLIMMVMEKHHDIAILKSMGASASSIMRVFIMQGAFIGLVGTGIGCGLGLVVCWVADTYQLIRLEGGVYFLNYLPFRVMPLDVSLVALFSLAICVISALYPAKQASKLDPAVALRCE